LEVRKVRAINPATPTYCVTDPDDGQQYMVLVINGRAECSACPANLICEHAEAVREKREDTIRRAMS
jgi:hypothetical protein